MKQLLLKLASVALLSLSVASFSKADPINGEIDLSHYGSVATVDFVNKTVTFTTGANSDVGFATGDYASLLGSSASYLSFSYAANAPSQTVWKIDDSTYFVLDTFSFVDTQGTVGLSLWGTGTAYLAGHDATFGEWTFSASTTPGNVAFNFSSTNTVPDGGMTALLVGVGLVGMSMVARRRK